jgi:hypothetical protein
MLIQSTLLALGLIGSLFLFLSLKQEIRTHARRHHMRLEEVERQLRDAVRSCTREDAVPPPPPRPGFNLNKRVHAMRMLCRGQDLAHIAAALGVPRREVELLVRVTRSMTVAPQ